MDSVAFYLMLVALSVPFTATVQEAACTACNCQFNNLELLTEFIESKIAAARTNESTTGVTYTRWGKSSCPNDTGAQLVYSGRTGGTNWNLRGGSAEKICLPDDPEYANETSGVSIPYFSTIQGAEYELWGDPNTDASNYNAPCAVCYVPTRSTTITVPAKMTCPPSWTKEYYGYLTAEHDTHHRSSYTCLDNTPEKVPGSLRQLHTDGLVLIYYAITDCNGLPCPPYERSRILSCAVCTK